MTEHEEVDNSTFETGSTPSAPEHEGPKIGETRPAPKIGDTKPSEPSGGEFVAPVTPVSTREEGRQPTPVVAATSEEAEEKEAPGGTGRKRRRRGGRERRGKSVGRYMMCVHVQGDHDPHRHARRAHPRRALRCQRNRRNNADRWKPLSRASTKCAAWHGSRVR